jgi:hypothetical protein
MHLVVVMLQTLVVSMVLVLMPVGGFRIKIDKVNALESSKRVHSDGFNSVSDEALEANWFSFSISP